MKVDHNVELLAPAGSYEAFEAAVLGVYLHGLIGDEIFKNKYVINARDLIKMIPKTIKILYNRKK